MGRNDFFASVSCVAVVRIGLKRARVDSVDVVRAVEEVLLDRHRRVMDHVVAVQPARSIVRLLGSS